MITIHTSIGLTKAGLMDIVLQNEREDLLAFIAALDAAAQDWEFTEPLIAHFKALEAQLLSEEPGYSVEPKLIKVP